MQDILGGKGRGSCQTPDDSKAKQQQREASAGRERFEVWYHIRA